MDNSHYSQEMLSIPVCSVRYLVTIGEVCEELDKAKLTCAICCLNKKEKEFEVVASGDMSQT